MEHERINKISQKLLLTLTVGAGVLGVAGCKEEVSSQLPYSPTYVSLDSEFVDLPKIEKNKQILSIYPEEISIPSLGIEREKVQRSDAELINGVSYRVSVPDVGIATPPPKIDNLPRVTWVYAHSFINGEKGTFVNLNHLSVGDQIFINGHDEEGRADVYNYTYEVGGFFLADKESGGKLASEFNKSEEGEILLLQTSVRENGSKKWLIPKNEILGKAINVVEGDLEDPSRYLLLFVIATHK